MSICMRVWSLTWVVFVLLSWFFSVVFVLPCYLRSFSLFLFQQKDEVSSYNGFLSYFGVFCDCRNSTVFHSMKNCLFFFILLHQFLHKEMNHAWKSDHTHMNWNKVVYGKIWTEMANSMKETKMFENPSMFM